MPDALKQLVGEDVYKQHIELKLGAEKNTFFGEGEFIPKGRFDEANNQVKDLKTQITERDKQLEDLKKAAANNDELKKNRRVDRPQQEDSRGVREKIAEKEYEYEFEKSLSAAKPKDVNPKSSYRPVKESPIRTASSTSSRDRSKRLKKSHDYVFEAEQSLAKPAFPTSSGLQPAGGKVVPSAAGNQAQQQQTIKGRGTAAAHSSRFNLRRFIS